MKAIERQEVHLPNNSDLTLTLSHASSLHLVTSYPYTLTVSRSTFSPSRARNPGKIIRK